jgi:hypothetical protein
MPYEDDDDRHASTSTRRPAFDASCCSDVESARAAVAAADGALRIHMVSIVDNPFKRPLYNELRNANMHPTFLLVDVEIIFESI